MTNLIANARMYRVAPAAADAWERLFHWLSERSGVPLTVIDHAYPALLNDLWHRPDLGAAFICGWPYLRMNLGHQLLAAPIPSAPYAEGLPRYVTHFVVHRDAPFERLEDTFGHRFAFTIQDSHSGYNAPRHHLMRYRQGDKPLFGEIIGPLTTQRRMLDAIAERRTDVGPLDSFAYDLLCKHEPELAAQTRVIASSAPMQMPALAASAGVDPIIAAKLTDALVSLTADTSKHARGLKAELCLSGFAQIAPTPYAQAETWAQEAASAGLEHIT